MKNLKRKGFTIIELVIVIAVIAVLAAVLIPTFSSLVKKANMSADMQVVRNMNTALAADEIVGGKPATVVEAQEVLIENGISNFKTHDSNNAYYWVGIDNRVILWDMINNKVTYPEEYVKKYKDVNSPSIDWSLLDSDYGVININPEGGETIEEALLSGIEEANSGDIIVLPKNSNISMSLAGIEEKMIIDGGIGKTITIDLNDSIIASNDGLTLNVPVSGALTMLNGTIENTLLPGRSKSAITIDTGAKIEFKNMTCKTNGVALFPEGDASEVIVLDSDIQGGGFGVATNNQSSNNIHIKLENTNISAYNDTDGFTGVMINVPGLLEIYNCKIVGDYQGIIVRGSTAIIKDCDVSITEEYWGSDYFGNINWSDGNMVTLAPITIGNKHPNSYKTPSNVTIINSKFSVKDSGPAMYAYANPEEGLGVTITYDNTSVFNGTIEYGNNGNNIIVNGESVATN